MERCEKSKPAKEEENQLQFCHHKYLQSLEHVSWYRTIPQFLNFHVLPVFIQYVALGFLFYMSSSKKIPILKLWQEIQPRLFVFRNV